MSKVLLLASGMSAREVDDYDYKANGWTIVAINNGWLAHEDWDHWVRSSDFNGRRPKIKPGQVECRRYGHILKLYGDHDECGYSITLCAGYYSLHILKPTVIGLLGADMNYTPDDNGHTHIYGVGNDIKRNGMPDPDRMVKHHARGNPNYLSDIYMRFHSVAKESGCDVYNLSTVKDTRLPYPKARPEDFK